VPYAEFARAEARFGILSRKDPNARQTRTTQNDVTGRWNYQQLAGVERQAPEHAASAVLAETEEES
jgi:hypothetical protein